MAFITIIGFPNQYHHNYHHDDQHLHESVWRSLWPLSVLPRPYLVLAFKRWIHQSGLFNARLINLSTRVWWTPSFSDDRTSIQIENLFLLCFFYRLHRKHRSASHSLRLKILLFKTRMVVMKIQMLKFTPLNKTIILLKSPVILQSSGQ